MSSTFRTPPTAGRLSRLWAHQTSSLASGRIFLPVPREYDYTASLYAKHVSGPAQIRLSIRSNNSGEVLASSSVQAIGTDWQKYSCELKLVPGSVRRLEPVDFAISVDGDERVDVDPISLQPDDAIQTLDPEVVRMASAMHMTECISAATSAATTTGVTASAHSTGASPIKHRLGHP